MRIFNPCCWGVLLLSLLAAGPSVAADRFKITFTSTVDRVILPSGEVLKKPLVGAKLSGEAVLSSTGITASKRVQGEGAIWRGAVKSLYFGNDLPIRFSGGNVILAKDQLRLNAAKGHCTECKAEGPALQTKGEAASDADKAKTYFANSYLLVQGDGHESGQQSFDKLVSNMVTLANQGKTKVMLQFSEKGSDATPLKLVLSVSSMKAD